ncbi:MAG: aspartate aminotransferase family protein [Flavobacteriaceae bacterium]
MRADFLSYQARTSPQPLGIEVKKAKGSYIWDQDGKKYLDFIAGVSACPLGHRHSEVVKAIRKQSRKYLHVMVYGEFAQEPAVCLSKQLIDQLPDSLEQLYLTNSGTEAIEGALKMAKRFTGRTELVAAHESYHGSTHGALSVTGYEPQKKGYGPLLPEVNFIVFNQVKDLEKITDKTAAVILETIQGGAGFIVPKPGYLQAVHKRCKEVGALLILDEIQPGFGRTGTLFGFQHYGIVPDILVMGKGMGGGLPIGAFASSKEIFNCLTKEPALGHITTFGGNPLIAAAANATLSTLLEKNIMTDISRKEALFRSQLVHPKILEIRGRGLMLAPLFRDSETARQLVLKGLEKGLILFWLLWEKRAVRISPPLTISENEIRKGCRMIKEILDTLPTDVN